MNGDQTCHGFGDDEEQEHDVASPQNEYQRQLEAVRFRESLQQTQDDNRSTRDRQGLLDDPTRLPIEIREYVAKDLPLTTDVLRHADQFRRGQARDLVELVNTPFGQVRPFPADAGAATVTALANAIAVNAAVAVSRVPVQRQIRQRPRNVSQNAAVRNVRSSPDALPATPIHLALATVQVPAAPTDILTAQPSIDSAAASAWKMKDLATYSNTFNPTPLTVRSRVAQTTVATKNSDGSYSVETTDGTVAPAVLFSEVYRQNETENKTKMPPEHDSWTEDRSARPNILYAIRPDQRFRARMRQTVAEKNNKRTDTVYEGATDATGRILLNRFKKPLRYFSHLPEFFSNNTPGWYLEALFRIDPVVKHDDMIDRMPSTNGIWIPTTRTLHQRRARARHARRITNWQPNISPDDLWEQVIEEDLDDWARANNSTERLADLTFEQISLYEALQEHHQPTPTKDKQASIDKLRANLARAKAAGYRDDHRFVTDIEERIKVWQRS